MTRWLISCLLFCLLSLPGFAQYAVTHSFAGSDGQTPQVGAGTTPSLNGNYLWGTVSTSSSNNGQIFKITHSGTFTTLVTSVGSGLHLTSPVVEDGAGVLYGVTDGSGVIYKAVNSGGTWTVTQLYTTAGSTQGRIVTEHCPGTTHVCLYGTTTSSGANSKGSIWQLDTHGTPSYTILYSFVGNNTTVHDGANPIGGLVEAPPEPPFNPSNLPGDLCGTTSTSGASGGGTLFCWNFAGGGSLNVIYSFGGTGDGSSPYGAPFMVGESGGTNNYMFYGTTRGGGANNQGTVWSYDSSTNTELLLHSFGGASDGDQPDAKLNSDGVFLYGTTEQGGSNFGGTAFEIKPDGSSYSKLVEFTSQSSTDGYDPQSEVSVFNGHEYTLTKFGGVNNCMILNQHGCGTLTEIQ